MTRSLVAALAACWLAALAPGTARADDYPNKPIRLVVPFPPGGPTDLFGRLIGNALDAAWGQPVIADNRPGATGTIGTAVVVKAPPDGYTLLMAATSSHISPYLYQNQSYDPDGDLEPVVRVLSLPFYLIGHPSVPATTLTELVAEVKRRPGALSYSSPGAGSAGNLVMEMFKRDAGLDIVHVPYKGSGPGIAALVAGEVALAFDTVTTTHAHVAAGRLKDFAITGPTRAAIAPNAPTLMEAGYPNFTDVAIWFGIFAPKGTPPALVDKLNRAITTIMQGPAMQQRLTELSGAFVAQSPAEFRAFVATDTQRWKQIIVATGARAE
jgi:tripartite-type tricarboxylate transporter receptor subunit TctC